MATARLMETWAHGQDVADALGVTRRPTDRLRHVAHIGVRARDFAYHVNGLTPPAEEFRVELVGPSGDSLVVGARAGGATSEWTGPRLLPARHRNGATATISPSPPRAPTPSSG